MRGLEYVSDPRFFVECKEIEENIHKLLTFTNNTKSRHESLLT